MDQLTHSDGSDSHSANAVRGTRHNLEQRGLQGLRVSKRHLERGNKGIIGYKVNHIQGLELRREVEVDASGLFILYRLDGVGIGRCTCMTGERVLVMKVDVIRRW